MEEENNIENEEEVKITEENNDEKQDNATFTQSEVDRQISKAVESALSRREAKLEEEYAEKIEKERQDAIQYAKLTQKEQEEAEFNKRMEELEQREKELNDRQLLNQIESDLKENNLPTSFSETLLRSEERRVGKAGRSRYRQTT